MRPRRLVRLLGPGRTVAAVVLLAVVATAAVPGWSPYRIKAGDTLWGLARSHHTTVAEIEKVNHLNGPLIDAGALLLLPGSEGTGSEGTGGAGAGRGAGTVARAYVVAPGDTVTAIARRFGSSVGAIARANHLDSADVIDIGQRLVIPGTAAATRRPGSGNGNGSGGPDRLAGPPASEASVVALIRSTSTRLGVPADLALAIGFQESGFQQQVVSPTGAVGVMQVEPATASWLSGIAGRRLDPENLSQNVYAGVLLLHLLLGVTNEQDAIAGYYQGLGSVQRSGMLPSTRQYVRDVLALAARFR